MSVVEPETCDCSDGCLCTACRVCRLKHVGTGLQALPPGLSDAEVRRRRREEQLEAELELGVVGEPEDAEWGDDPDPNAWGLHPIPVDRERVVFQSGLGAERPSVVMALLTKHPELDGRGFRVTVEVLGEGESPAGDSGAADEDVERETTWT